MAERESVFPIPKETLEKHLKKVDEHIESVNRGSFERESLTTLLRGVGISNQNMMAKEVQDTVEALRSGFSLFYEMNAVLEDRVKATDGNIDESEKRLFLNSYSMFAASSFIKYKLGLLAGEDSPSDFKSEGVTFNLDLSKDDALNGVLARYFGLINTAKRNNKFEKGKEVPLGSYNFFKFLEESALSKKTSFNPKLVELVKNAQFRIADEFNITGFEASHEEKTKAKVEFVPVMPYQVAGNVLAKKEMLRDMDRMALFDLIAQKNPIIDVGGLSWSVLYDGFPGTGKSKLFRMGLTRLRQRSEQVSQFWKSKNMGDLKWNQIIIDQGVKNEFYGKTGTQLLEKLAPAKRPDGLYIITTDDIDLLANMDRGSSSGGADKDILNILMQFADGINTVIRGNVQWWAATNDATAMDPALRQRFIARYSVDGPQEWYDFADILVDEFSKELKLGIIDVSLGKDYKPYEMRKGQTGYEGIGGEKNVLKKALSISGTSFKEIGELCREKKEKNPRFTGRATHAVAEAIKKRVNDYDIPEDWYEKPEVFFGQEYPRRVEMLKEFCKKVSGDVIIQEIERYAQSEQRYADDKWESDVKRKVHEMKVYVEATKRCGGSAKNA